MININKKKYMKITVFNIKGGQGKTSIAANLALTLNAGIITNDVYSPLKAILPEDQFIKVYPDSDFPTIPDDIPIVYDLGGWIDVRTIPILKESDLILIPMINDFVNNQVSLNTIEEVRKHNKNIVIIANRAEKGDFECVSLLMENFFKNEFPIFELRKTTAFSKIFERKQSIKEIVNNDKLLAFSYRTANEQFDDLIKYINKIG